MDYDSLKKYLVQNAPLPFHPNFKWGTAVLSKLNIYDFAVPQYNIFLVFNSKEEQLFKPYEDIIVSDRVKKINDSIHDIQVRVLGEKDSPLAIMWYASTNFYGTVIDTTIKGLRIRQGNLLIGDNNSVFGTKLNSL